MRRLTSAISTLFILLFPMSELSFGSELGEREFMSSCAQCHGTDGTGNGVMTEFLSVKAADLTVFQMNNGGVFPVSRLYKVIEGSNDPGVHGTSEMPAWGDRYNAKASVQLGELFSESDQESFVRGRILALIEYISTLQKK